MLWTGNEMIVWGGYRGTSLAIYTLSIFSDGFESGDTYQWSATIH
jgi:hypothetical protein